MELTTAASLALALCCASATHGGSTDGLLYTTVGEVPGEYCPGEFSVNAAGRTKLAGSAQRVTRWGFLISIVLVLSRPDPLRAVVDAAYRALGLPCDPAVVGAVSDHAPGVSRDDVVGALVAELARVMPDLTAP